MDATDSACTGPVEKWFPYTPPPGDPVLRATQCYWHTTDVVQTVVFVVVLLCVAGMFALAIAQSVRLRGGWR